ncbi:SAF domain-containing protein [Promicromonospora sp. NPDC060271]|uniref:SAF domain-containing protein n=1 Tax=Promicromonospora sp. NPDC060271 TaxID=3347089 RepID=UPI0036492D1F
MGLLDSITEPASRHGSPPGAGSPTQWGTVAGAAPPSTDRPMGARGLLTRPSGRRSGQSGPGRSGLGLPGPGLPGPGRSGLGLPGTASSRSAVLRRARRILWRWRFALAAALFGLAASVTVHLLRPPPPPTTDVAVTARPVAAGTELTRDDVVVRSVAADLAPPGTLPTVHGLLGRSVVVGLPAGAPLHTTLVSDDGVSAAAPHGTVVVPVRLSDDAVAALLRPGDRIDLLAGTTSGGEPDGAPRYLARRALVLPVPAGREPEAAGGLLGPAADGDRPVTLVAVTPADAPELSAISGWGAVTAVLVP